MDSISVIVPVYNVEKYFDCCIQSILNQTYQNLEIILVNDGSKDKSAAMCDRYAKADRRIKVIHKENGGLSSARNEGLNIATGEYVAFVDSDDYIHHKMYETIMERMKQTNAEIGICDYKEVTVNESPDLDKVPPNINSTLLTANEAHDAYYIYEKKARFIVAWNKIYKRKLFDDIRYPLGKIHEDTFTTYKVLFRTKRIVWVDYPFYFYRIDRDESIMNQEFCVKRLFILDALQDEMAFLREVGQTYLWGVVFMDYRDYITIFHKQMLADRMDLKQLKPYIKYLNQNLKHMKKMELEFKKRVKTYVLAKFGMCVIS